MAQHVQVIAGTPEVIAGIGKQSKKPFTMCKQPAMLVHDDGRVEAFTITRFGERGESVQPLAPGKFALGTRAYIENGELRLAPSYTSLPGAPAK